MRRYVPPNGTAGFARSAVRGARRLPSPPARTIANTLSEATTLLSLEASRSVQARARELLDDLAERAELVGGLAVGAGRVARVDALQDRGELPVGECEEEVEL